MLVTSAELATALGIDPAAIDTPRAELVISRATTTVQDAVGQRLVDATDTAVLDILTWSQWLDLPQKPIRSVTSVVLDGTPITDWRLTRHRLWRASGWGAWMPYGSVLLVEPSQALVTYAHGYAVGTQALETARNAVFALACPAYGNPEANSTESADGYTASLDARSARMELTEYTRQQLINTYGCGATVTTSDGG